MNKLNDIPAVEPLSDTSWRRIERAVFAELARAPAPAPAWRAPAGRRWRRPIIGMTGLAAAAVLFLVLRGAPEGGMPQPSRIVTDEAPVALTVGRAALRVAPRSAMWVHSGHGREVMVVLEQGRVDCAVAHDEDQPPLVVQAGDVRVEVVGTSFSVMRRGSSAQVEVREGVVKVFHDGARVLVEAGQQWPPGDQAQAVEPAAPERAPERAIEPAAPGSPEPEEKPAGEDDAAGERADTPARAPVDIRGRGQEQASRATREPRRSGAERAPRREASPKERYEQAAAMEAARPGAAIVIYRELARGKSGWAAPALFAQARLELERGQRGPARRLLRAYLQRYPRGINAPDARALLAATER